MTSERSKRRDFLSLIFISKSKTQKGLKNSEGFDWLESTELAIDKRKFLLTRFYEKQLIPQDQD